MGARKDFTGVRYGDLVAVAPHHVEKKPNGVNGRWYWTFECDCGGSVVGIPNAIRSNKHQMCEDCRRASGSWAWQGVGEFPGSHYREIYHSAQARGFTLEVTKDYLWDLYLKQDRRCAFTGWKIRFMSSYSRKHEKTASLDRIDSSVGYVEGNLQWVHRDVNKLKKNMGDARFIELCIAVANGPMAAEARQYPQS